MTESQRCLSTRIEFLSVLVCLLVFGIGGCSKPEPVVIVDVPPTPMTADQAVQNVLSGLQRQELGELWTFLPAGYQHDIQALAQDFAQRLDDTAWSPFAAICQKAHAVVSHLIKIHDESLNEASDADKSLAVQLRAVEQALSALCDSELINVSRLRSINVPHFVSGTGNKLIAAMSQDALSDIGLGGTLFAQFGDVKVELLESEGDSAVVTVQWPGQDATQHRFVRVQERWIPQPLSEAWPTEFPKVRDQCLAWADELRSNPELWHARLRKIDGLLNDLAETKSLTEARRVWNVGLSQLALEWFGAVAVESPKNQESAIDPRRPPQSARVKRPDTEVLLPDEPNDK